LLLCSGEPKDFDIAFYLRQFLLEAGVSAHVATIDPACHALLDLVNAKFVRQLDLDASNGRFCACFASPPCSTVSAVRHRLLSGKRGPRPFRSRQDPLKPLKYSSKKERYQCLLGAHLFGVCMDLLYRVACASGWAGFEHPADRGVESYPSFCNSSIMQHMLNNIESRVF
jgi:hypothetical protein